MIETREFERIPEAGIVKLFHFDSDTEEVTLEIQHDVEPVVGATRSVYNDFDERANWKGDWHHVGIIPMEILQDIMTKNPAREDQQRALRTWLNNPDNRAFRSRPGRV